MRNSRDRVSPVSRTFTNGRRTLDFVWTGGVLVFVALSGLLIWLFPFGAGSQMIVLFHTVAGALLLVPLILWLLTHWLATRKKGRGVGNILAYAGFCLLGICIAAGLIITYQALFGTFASHLWANIHLWSGVLAVPVLAYHVLRREQEGVPGSRVSAENIPSTRSPYRSRSWKRTFAMAAALCALPAIGRLAYHSPSFSSYRPPSSFQPAPGSNPFAPSHAETENGRPISPQITASSHACGASGCHSAIYKEWAASAHRWSEEDEFFQAVRDATTKVQGISATEKCGGCHAPVSMLSGYKDPRLGKSTPGYQEGDSCVVCHAVRHVDERGIGSYELGVPKPYLYDHSGSHYARLINHFLIRVYPGQHDRDYDLKIPEQAESCAPCHKEFDVVGNHPGLLQVETQYDDWKHNRWNTDPNTSRRLRCQQCHMFYQVVANRGQADPYDLELGRGLKYHNHRFAAANQYTPLVLNSPDAAEQVSKVRQWLEGKQSVPEIENVWPEGPIVAVAIQAPPSAHRGDMISVEVQLTNKKAGHSFPTGPLNVGRVWMELDVRDKRGKEIFHSGGLDGKNHVENGAYVLRPIAIRESGQTIMTTDIWHPKGLEYRPAIPPGKTESFDYHFAVPKHVTGPLLVKVRLRYRKANQFFMNAVYPRQDHETPITDVGSASAQITMGGGAPARMLGKTSFPLGKLEARIP